MTALRTAVVTGAGQGIGRGIARRLRADGFEVVVLDIDEVKAEETAGMVEGRAVVCDVADQAAVKEVAAGIGRVDVLVNNVGVWAFGTLLDAAAEDLERVLRINVLGTLYCCQAFAPAMIAAGTGSVVNISSGSALSLTMGVEVYPSAKAAVDALTRQMSLELRPIRVNGIRVGPMEAMRRGQEGLRDLVPVGRLCTPEDIAGGVSYLASDDAAFVSGQVLTIDGGLLATRPIEIPKARVENRWDAG